jgi:hypothetical protein
MLPVSGAGRNGNVKAEAVIFCKKSRRELIVIGLRLNVIPGKRRSI